MRAFCKGGLLERGPIREGAYKIKGLLEKGFIRKGPY